MNLLIPVDFSDTSLDALKYAKSVFSGQKVNVHLVHVVDMSVFAMTDPMMNINIPDLNDLIESSNQTLNKWVGEYNTPDFAIFPSSSTGFFRDKILEIADELKPDYIIMGTKGASGIFSKLAGSNTVSVIDNTHFPVIVIPTDNTVTKVKKIAFASTMNMDETGLYDSVFNFAQALNAQVQLVHLLINDEDQFHDKDKINEYLSTHYQHIPYEIIMRNADELSEALKDHCSENQVDLLVLSTHDRGWFAKIFNPSKTIDIALHAYMPLLVFKHSN